MIPSLQILAHPEGEDLPQRAFVAESLPFDIGRDPGCDLCLPDHRGILSRHHLRLDFSNAYGVVAEDFSANGSRLNGVAMTRGTAYPVFDGSLIELGGYRLMVSLASAQPRPSPATSGAARAPTGQMTVTPFEENEEASSTQGMVAATPLGQDLDDLDSRLLFDPFESGPNLRETPTTTQSQPAAPIPASEYSKVQPVDRQSAPVHHPSQGWAMTAPEPSPGPFEEAAEREAFSAAMDRALLRLLEQFDPELLEKEFDDFLGLFSRGRGRYWSIYRKQFARRQHNGDYIRAFRALLAEEVRRK